MKTDKFELQAAPAELPETSHDDDDGDRNASGDKSTFDGGCPRLVLHETCK
jgi:hypothetical protein